MDGWRIPFMGNRCLDHGTYHEISTGQVLRLCQSALVIKKKCSTPSRANYVCFECCEKKAGQDITQLINVTNQHKLIMYKHQQVIRAAVSLFGERAGTFGFVAFTSRRNRPNTQRSGFKPLSNRDIKVVTRSLCPSAISAQKFPQAAKSAQSAEGLWLWRSFCSWPSFCSGASFK